MEPVTAANDAISALGSGSTSAYVTLGTSGIVLAIALWKTLVKTLHKMQLDRSSVVTRKDLDTSLVDMIAELRAQLISERERTTVEQERADRATKELQEAIRQAAEAKGQLEAIKTELESLRREVQLLRQLHQGDRHD